MAFDWCRTQLGLVWLRGQCPSRAIPLESNEQIDFFLCQRPVTEPNHINSCCREQVFRSYEVIQIHMDRSKRGNSTELGEKSVTREILRYSSQLQKICCSSE